MKRIAASLMVCVSCSWALMERAPDKWAPATGEPRCTGAVGFAVWDALQAAAYVVVAIAAGKTQTETTPFEGSKITEEGAAVIAGALAAGVAHAASAVTGARWVRECDEKRAARDAYMKSALERPSVERRTTAPMDAGVSPLAAPADATLDVQLDAQIWQRPADTEDPPRR